MRRTVRTLLTLSVFGLLACLTTPEIARAAPVSPWQFGSSAGSLLGFTGPVGIDPRSMPAFAAVHPLVVAGIQVGVSLMALIAFPVSRVVKEQVRR